MNAIPCKRRGVFAVRAETSGEVKAALLDMNNAFAEFKRTHDERLGNLESRLDGIEAGANRLRAGGGVTAGGLEPEHLAIWSQFRGFKGGDQAPDPEFARAYSAGWAQYLRAGEASFSNEIRAAMSVGSDPDGGFFAPPERSMEIVQRIFDTSPMRQLADVQETTKSAVEFPNAPNRQSTGGWVGETETRSETDTAEAGMQTIYVREQYALPKVTQKLIDDGDIDVARWLGGQIADELGRQENTAFISGAGVKSPKGFLTYKDSAVTTADASRAWGVLQYIATGAAGAFPTLSGGAANLDALYDTVAALKGIYRRNATWLMNRSTAAHLAKLKDADGRPLWQPSPAAGQPPSLLGYPVRDDFEDMPDIASDSFSIAFGDFQRGYRIYDNRMIRVLRDPYTSKGWVKFYTTKRVGADVVDFDAIKLVKFAAS